jgi:hypothetical protein
MLRGEKEEISFGQGQQEQCAHIKYEPTAARLAETA